MHRHNRASEGRGERFHHAIEVGALAVGACAHNHPRQRDPVVVIPDALGHHFHAADGVHHDQRGFHRGHHHLGFMDEHVEAGRVDQVDLGFAPLDESGGGGDGHGPRDLFFVVIGDGGAFIDPAEALGGAGGEKHRRGEGSFARMGMPDQGDVADVCAFVILHLWTPSSEPCTRSALHLALRGIAPQ